MSVMSTTQQYESTMKVMSLDLISEVKKMKFTTSFKVWLSNIAQSAVAKEDKIVR